MLLLLSDYQINILSVRQRYSMRAVSVRRRTDVHAAYFVRAASVRRPCGVRAASVQVIWCVRAAPHGRRTDPHGSARGRTAPHGMSPLLSSYFGCNINPQIRGFMVMMLVKAFL